VKAAHFSNTYDHEILQDLMLNGGSAVPTSQIQTAVMLVLITTKAEMY
jgi:hypothetical protein